MKKKINFGESLRDIMIVKNVSVKELAKDVKISKSSIYSWLRNTTEPNLSYLITLADYFHCSIEYLIGRNDDDKYIESKPLPSITKRIRQIMSEIGISTYKLRKISRYDGAYFYNWEHGSEPLLSTLIEISSILNCTIDYLTGRD